MNNTPLIKAYKQRRRRYETAVAMAKGKIPTDNSFRWPFYPGFTPKDPKNVHYWNGCIAELNSVIKDLEDASRPSSAGAVNATLPLTATSSGIRVNGHMGTWHVVQEKKGPNGQTTFVLEHEIYGELAEHLLVDENAAIIRKYGKEAEYESYDDDYADFYDDDF